MWRVCFGTGFGPVVRLLNESTSRWNFERKKLQHDDWNIHQNHCANFASPTGLESTPNSSVILHLIYSIMLTVYRLAYTLPTSIVLQRIWVPTTTHLFVCVVKRHRGLLSVSYCIQWGQFHGFSSYGVPLAKKGRRKHNIHTHIRRRFRWAVTGRTDLVRVKVTKYWTFYMATKIVCSFVQWCGQTITLRTTQMECRYALWSVSELKYYHYFILQYVMHTIYNV